MTQEEKELLLKDISARLLYGLICQVEFKDSEGWKVQNMSLEGVFMNECYFTTDTGSTYSKEFKPYLRSLSSMTEEEKEEYINIKQGECNGCVLTGKGDPNTEFLLVDFFNAHHFDYRGLIPMGLALEAPEVMYKHFGDMDVIVTSVEHKDKL